MTLRLRLVDKQTGEVLPIDRIDFHAGRPRIIYANGEQNGWDAGRYEVQAHLKVGDGEGGLLGHNWKPAEIVFES
jgi:hypothetical protein